jgi:hypothetical protein
MTLQSAAGGGLSDNLLPWLVNVDASMTPVSHVNWNTNLVDGNAPYRLIRDTSPVAQNNEISFDVVLAAGTWTFELIHYRDVDRGIYTVLFGGVAKGTIDGYTPAGTPPFLTRSPITGVVVVASGKVRVTLRMATKNVSSSGYRGSLSHIQFKRTS